MTERILSISGLRGVIGNGLDPEYLTRFACVLGTMFEGGTVVLSRDGRSTGPMVKHAMIAGLLATGCRVVDAGIATTPTCGVLVTHLKAAGGLQITASHNPVQWNGPMRVRLLKFIQTNTARPTMFLSGTKPQ